MIHRNLSIQAPLFVERARRLRQRRKRRQKWIWGSVAAALSLGTAALLRSFLPAGKGSSSVSQSPELEHAMEAEWWISIPLFDLHGQTAKVEILGLCTPCFVHIHLLPHQWLPPEKCDLKSKKMMQRCLLVVYFCATIADVPHIIVRSLVPEAFSPTWMLYSICYIFQSWNIPGMWKFCHFWAEQHGDLNIDN